MLPEFKEDEGFWEFGFHFFLVLLIALPVTFLTEHLATIANVKDHAPVIFGLLIGVPLGEAIIGRLRRRFGRASAPGESSQPEPDDARQPLFLVLPIALPVAVLVDFITTLMNIRDGASAAIGAWIGMSLGDWAFHSLRKKYRRGNP